MRGASDSYVRAVVQRSAPKVDRPRLPTEYEDLFRRGDAERAACYARMERMAEQLSAIVDALDSEAAEPGIVVGVNEGDSLVHHIDEAVAVIGSR